MKENAGKIDPELAEEFEADHSDRYLNVIKPDGRTLMDYLKTVQRSRGHIIINLTVLSRQKY